MMAESQGWEKLARVEDVSMEMGHPGWSLATGQILKQKEVSGIMVSACPKREKFPVPQSFAVNQA